MDEVTVSNPDGPLDQDRFLLCARDTVKLLRNHPSLALNGGTSAITPVIKDPIQYLDGTRVYIQGSMWDGFADGKGDFTDGPYEIQNPEDFFKPDYYKYGFNPEVGNVGMPVAATIRATMPPEGWQIPLFKKLSNGYIEEVPNPIWTYHKYIAYSKPGKAQLVNYIQYRALLEGYTSHTWSKYTGFYGCRSAAEPIHVQFNLATYSIEVVNTTSEELPNVAIEASVWDLERECPYYKTSEKLTVPPKKTISTFEMEYLKSKNPKPVYFLLPKLYDASDYRIYSRNFYWTGGDYKLLEPLRERRPPLKITSLTFIKGSTYEMRMHIHNTSKKPDSNTLLYRNNFIRKNSSGDELDSSESISLLHWEKHEISLYEKIRRNFSREHNQAKVSEVNGTGKGVAFFLHFSVHASKKEHKNGEDTRILPVHYSDNYFSLVPGEVMTVTISFEVPPSVTPRVTLHGWNHHDGHTVL
ncbi:hypothetical protein RND71_000827 [Anisodus tanguticus]|uniref:Exo-beta-D-glucosaminidase Ig-fold domain-containing protein n=1 Tax=Anisodus tanguticus TaxID=243964 RepID=A0AAE1T083_9SOLA|nr:hypothetical protein RND71_000827 [Anisodus tanguticus]